MSDQNLELTGSNDKRETGLLSRIVGGSNVVGGIVSAVGCAVCFSTAASIGATIGLGFLYPWKGLFVNTLIPLFAVIVLLANGIGWFAHRSPVRGFIGIAGPVLVLLAVYTLSPHTTDRTAVLYTGLALMTAFGLWDTFIRPRMKKA